MIRVTERGGSVVFEVRVQPRSRREEVGGEWEGALRVRIQEPPVEGRANEAVIRLLAARLKRPASAVRIVAGSRGRVKRVEIKGATARQIIALSGEAAV